MKAKPSEHRTRRSASFLAISLGFALAPAATAATKTWSTTTGSLSASGSWSATGTPVTTDEALFDGTVTPVLMTGYTPVVNDAFNLADWTGTFSGTPTFDYSAAILGAGLAWDSSTFASDGILRVAAVPEPAASLIGGLSLLTIVLRRRRF